MSAGAASVTEPTISSGRAWVLHRRTRGADGVARDHRPGLPERSTEGRAPRLDRIEGGGIGEVPPLRVAAAGGEEGGRRRDGRVRDRFAELLQGRDGIARDLVGGHALVHDLVHEGAVGTVLQQAADEIGEQVVVRAHRGVDAAAMTVRRAHRRVQGLAHPVQALELEVRALARHVQHRRHRVRVVGRELRIEPVRHPEQAARARQIADICAGLAGEDREAGEALHLGALDFGIPVGALDQPHHHAAPVRLGERPDPIDHVRGPLAVGLHHHAEAIPACQMRGRRAPPR